jgi:hypothetical protein
MTAAKQMANLIAKIRSVVAAIPEAERTPTAQLLDTILSDYWRMEKPSKRDLLQCYRTRCYGTLSPMWTNHHCELAAFCEEIVGTGILRN